MQATVMDMNGGCARGGIVGIRSRRDFSRFDPSPGEARPPVCSCVSKVVEKFESVVFFITEKGRIGLRKVASRRRHRAAKRA